MALVCPQCGRCWHVSLICCIDRAFWCYQSILLVCRYKLSVFCWWIVFFFMFGKPSASSFSGNILRNVETGRVFPCAPVSIFRRNFRFGNLMLMSRKASSLWVLFNTIERQAFHLFFSFSVVVYCISFHVVFSYIVVDSEILVFVFSALWPRPLFWFHSVWQTYWCPVVCFTYVLHFDSNAGQASRRKAWLYHIWDNYLTL